MADRVLEIHEGIRYTTPTLLKIVDNGDGTWTLGASVQDSVLPADAATETKQNTAIANQTNGTQQAKVKETAPTDATKNNGSLVLTYTGDNLTTIAKTISGTTYNKTLAYTGARLDSVSAWVAA